MTTVGRRGGGRRGFKGQIRKKRRSYLKDGAKYDRAKDLDPSDCVFFMGLNQLLVLCSFYLGDSSMLGDKCMRWVNG